MRQLATLFLVMSAMALTGASSLAGAQESNPTDQRCVEIINSIEAVPTNDAGQIFVDKDFATAVAQREGVSVETVEECVERYNSGELSISPKGVSEQEQIQDKVVYGTDGFDRLSGTAGDDRILGFGSGDVMSEGYGDDLLRGGSGWDYVVGGYGSDVLYGESGSDWLDGGAGNDLVRGGTGDDLVDGGTNNDTVGGGDGNDAVYGYAGSDTLYGGTGNDLVYSAGDGTKDEVHGGPGYDVCIVGSEDDLSGCEEVYGG